MLLAVAVGAVALARKGGSKGEGYLFELQVKSIISSFDTFC
jgi:hypothetical protein